MADLTARNPRAEAEALIGRPARVLEPSPPAVAEEPFFADDPTALDGDPDAVTPTSAGTTTWTDLVAAAGADSAVAAFARDRWLAAWPALEPVPDGYGVGREAAHRLAYAVVAEARRRAHGKFGLRYTAGGFGTPFFGDDEQVRIADGSVIVQRRDTVTAEPITTLAAAAAFAGVEPGTAAAEHDSPPLGDVDADLGIDATLTDFLGAWFGFATSVLEELRVTDGAVDPGRVQMWPGHFDPAVEIGSEQGRATYGASPGDGSADEPYLYVGPWNGVDDDPFWNAESFSGAVLSYADLRAASDQRQRALAFYRDALTRLA